MLRQGEGRRQENQSDDDDDDGIVSGQTYEKQAIILIDQQVGIMRMIMYDGEYDDEYDHEFYHKE